LLSQQQQKESDNNQPLCGRLSQPEKEAETTKAKTLKRKKLLTKQRQQKLTANTDKPVNVQQNDVPATSNKDSLKS
jgi:hypothetical protein